MTKDEVIRIGDAARRMLNDEAVDLALKTIVDDAKDRWATSRPNDTEGRESTFRMISAVDAVKAQLKRMADDALVEASNAAFRAKEISGQSAHS